MNAQAWLDDVQALFRQYKRMGERAAAQVSDEDFFSALGRGDNSIAVVMKHLAGNHRSRWRAILRNLNHAAYHTGQIVQLARHFAGDAWRTLSIAPGESEEFNAAMRERHGDWWAAEGAVERNP